MLHAKLWSAGVLAGTLLLAACAGGPAPAASAVSQIVSTTSFGMCAGYCSTRLEISEGQAVLIRDSRGGRGGATLPEQRFNATLSAAEWDEFAQLAAAARIDGLPAVIGCPDCADGGAESLTIVRGASTAKTVTFEHGARIDEAQPLLERVRALRARLMPAQ